MIPRIFHRIWIGSSIPDEYEDYWDAWKRLHPDWQFRTWAEDDLEWLTNSADFHEARSPAQGADIARLEIVFRYGGVYLDCDIEPLRPIDELLHHSGFGVLEDDHYVCNAVLGAEPEHPLFQMLVENLPANRAAHIGADINLQTGPVFLTRTIYEGLWYDGEADMTLLPPVSFYPYHWSEPDPGVYPEQSYAVHHWAKAWT